MRILKIQNPKLIKKQRMAFIDERCLLSDKRILPKYFFKM